ncbi:YopX family protein [Tissierella pigra]|uniref:YopX protein domain-containing protein n=1 Tax=Tissierella pigra TaxID=2607614 RepID=A0A6N7XM92_9FIRM|nr:YopX family protein [Tissierella pigra]MSU01902.1 hypothetical protein [Tissierella pigra]
MQEIEVRAWNKENKIMVYDNEDNSATYWDGVFSSVVGFINFRLWYESVYEFMLYIGIKDIHKKKVFQGDIVKVKRFIFKDCRREEVEGMEEYIGEVVWHQFGWHIAEKIKDGIRYHSLWLWNIKDDETDPDTHFMEILSNIWENPEMKVIE